MALFGRRESKEEKVERKQKEKLDKQLDTEKNIKNSKPALKNIEGAREHLENNEEIIDYLFGMYDSKILGEDTKRNGVLVATNKRVIFYGKKMLGYELETIDYQKISSVDYSKGLVYGKLKIYTSGNDIEFETTMEHNARKFMQLIKEEAVSPQKDSTTNTPQKNSIEELKEYKELLDLEIITQEEFDAKKKELLK